MTGTTENEKIDQLVKEVAELRERVTNIEAHQKDLKAEIIVLKDYLKHIDHRTWGLQKIGGVIGGAKF